MNRILILVLLTIVGTSLAQQERNWGLEARVKAGYLVGHRVVMGHLPKEHAFAAELSYVIRPNGQKSWHKAYKYPDLSVNLFYGSVGNTRQLGNFLGAYSAINFPFISKPSFRLSGRLGAGLGYTSKVYDEVLAPKTVAISTHINALINVGLNAHYYFGKNWVSLGVEAVHFSNGGFKVPNLGLNLPYLNLSYGRFIRKSETLATEIQESAIPQRKLLFGLTAIGSVKQVFPSNGKYYPVYALNANMRMFVKPRVGWEVAFDVISKQAIGGIYPEIEKTQWKMLQMGVYAGYLLPLNQFHFVLGMGAYVKDYYQPEGPLYHRIGFRYYTKYGLLFNCVLKAHWGKADYVEWGIGYSFFNTKSKK